MKELAQTRDLDRDQPLTLAKRLSQGSLLLGYALQYATDIAAGLRSLHERGNLHGSVNADSVVITSAGAQLLLPNGRPDNTAAGADVSAFGELFYEMLTGSKPSRSNESLPDVAPRNSEEGLRAAAIRLASKCLVSTSNSSSEMQNVLTELRLLGLQTKIREKPAPAAPESRLVFHAKPQPRTSSSPDDGTPSRVFTPVPADGFLAIKEAAILDPAPSGIKCPACGVPYVYPSSTKSWFEIVLSAWGSPPLRCHRCLHRYVVIFKQFKISKGSPLKGGRYAPS